MKDLIHVRGRVEVSGDAFRFRRVVEIAADEQIDGGVASIHSSKDTMDLVPIFRTLLPFSVGNTGCPVAGNDDQVLAV